jgi:serine/threonine protein kinase
MAVEIVDEERKDLEESTVVLNVPGKPGRVLRPGDVLGDNYQLIELIGRGGMGVVYRCHHRIMQRDYALKVLSPDQVNEQSWLRFEVEGKAIAKLDHVNIVKIFNMGIYEGDCPFYVMELLEGDSLESLVSRDGPLSPEQAMPIFSQLAGAFAYAHKRGILHRDIKPSNIILQKEADGKYLVKVVDFGLAKLIDRQSVEGQSITSSGQVFGSPYYMSPEQGLGKEVNACSDIYSLGCTFYKTLTGRPPFVGENAFHTILMHQNDNAPRLDSAHPDKTFTPALEAMVGKMMAKHPRARYQSMEQVGTAISRLQSGIGQTSGPAPESGPDFPADNDAQRPHILEIFRSHIVAIALFALVTSGYIAFVFSRPPVPHLKIAAASVSGFPVEKAIEDKLESSPHQEVPGKKYVRDLELEKAEVDFRTFRYTPVKSSVVGKVPYADWYFPNSAVGLLQSNDGSTMPARAKVHASRCPPVILELNMVTNRPVFVHPEVLRKIDGTYINDIAFLEPNTIFSDGTGEAAVTSAKMVEIINIVSKWKDFCGLRFGDCPLSPEILKCLEGLPNLKRLMISGSSMKGKKLASYRIWDRLQVVDMAGVEGVDYILAALEKSQNLANLVIDHTEPSAEALSKLAQCPNLTSLSLENTRFNRAQLCALGSLPKLQALTIRKSKINPDDLISAAGLSKIPNMSVTSMGWSAEDIVRVKRALPHCGISGEEKSNDEIFSQ